MDISYFLMSCALCTSAAALNLPYGPFVLDKNVSLRKIVKRSDPSQITYCQYPGNIFNGWFVYLPKLNGRTRPYDDIETKYVEGSQLQYSCDFGYALEGSSTLSCQSTGRWSSKPPACKRDLCVNKSCRNNGRCEIENRRALCKCTAGYTGENCEIATSSFTYCQYPGDILNARVLHFPKNRRTRPSDKIEKEYPEGSRLQYSCEDGYALEGFFNLTCQSTGSWSSKPPTCKKNVLYCESPKPFPNGRIVHQPVGQSVSSTITLDDDTLYLEGSRLDYLCKKEYILVGSTTLICEKSGLWSGEAPVCRKNCPRLDSPMFGRVRCISTSEQHPKCKLFENLGLPNRVPRQINSSPCALKDIRSSFLFATCTAKCFPGYHFNSSIESEMTLTCREGEWIPRTSFPDCQFPRPLAYCSHPDDLTNGHLNILTLNEKRRPFDESEEEYPEGSQIQYSCMDGYVLEGSTTVTCTNTKKWSAEPPKCIPAPRPLTYCQYPGDILNGRVNHIPNLNERRRPYDEIEDEYPEGSRLRYSCDEGYTLKGSSTLTCQNTSDWSSGLPACEIDVEEESISCKNIGLISNGKAEYIAPVNRRRDPIADEFPVQSILEFSCVEGYRLQGDPSVTCQPTGSWSGNKPSCVADCGRSFMQTQNRIVNGSETISGDWPWVVSISVNDNSEETFICGGAVLNSHTVITAAHCLTHPFVLGKTLILRFGKHNFRVQGDDDEVLVRRSSRVIVQPNYSNKTFDSDIALVIFRPRIRYSIRVQPLCLPTRDSTSENIEPGKIGYVSGWGMTKDEVSPEKMMLASLPVISNRQCEDAYKQKSLKLTNNMFCAGYEDVRQSVCSGDSGSPFVFYDRKIKRYILEGLVSFSERGQCGVAGKYAIFTKVFRFRNWIIRLSNIRN